ncbi:short-chain dehydrogenase [Polyplosphaeria fusca]|uniref:Short-chain dehydrogenase n=1 Tax=Polyplosphaeria fusca TaxID=682080 RepID=A0A9P4UWC3_9PLEO|nr:short-chain dehydrogenase [Polyplosphaeria fusca]
MGVTLSQVFPPRPALTEANLPSQQGKVFVVTGGTSGVGFELAQILYGAGGTVFITARSEASLQTTIKSIKSSPSTNGSIDGVILDLADLTTVKPAVQHLLTKTSAINVLFLNAGVSQPPVGTTAQGQEIRMGINCLGGLLIAYLALPGLVRAAEEAKTRNEDPGNVRIVWTSSLFVDVGAPKGGFKMEDIIDPPKDTIATYNNSKLGNWYLAHHFSTLPQVRDNDILSITQNPGNLRSNLLRDAPWMFYISYPLLYHSRYGAYTELWAGITNEIGIGDQGCYILPWGRKHPAPRPDLLDSLKSKEEGGTGRADEFAEWSEDQIRQFR